MFAAYAQLKRARNGGAPEAWNRGYIQATRSVVKKTCRFTIEKRGRLLKIVALVLTNHITEFETAMLYNTMYQHVLGMHSCPRLDVIDSSSLDVLD